MNWKDHPHLFANGKFKCKVRDFKTIYTIEEYTSKGDELGLRRDEIVTFRTHASDCTLIARKIGDMTNEEKETFNDMMGIRTMDFQVDLFLYHLSIGVYPFNQSHFDTGEVIDIKTSDEA